MAGRGERVEADEQFAVTGMDVAGGGEGFADQCVGLVAGAGVVAVQGAGQGGFGVVCGHLAMTAPIGSDPHFVTVTCPVRAAAPAIRNDPYRYHASPACYSREKRDSW